ncbi:MAG: hypothetical protein ABI743_12680 [bacterium]
MTPLLICLALAVVLEWALYVRFLEMPPLRLLARCLVINALVMICAMTVSLSQFLFGDWPFLTSWGTRDLFLGFTMVELPIAWLILPRLPFTKYFSLVVLGNLTTIVVLTIILWGSPALLDISNLDVKNYEDETIDQGHVIQSAIEKFRTNHGGMVPDYVAGGDEGSWHGHGQTDRLLQEGLLEAFPVNPLHLGKGYLRPRQEWTLDGLFLGTKTPAFRELREHFHNLIDLEGEPRFGLKGLRMGNALSDPTIPTSKLPFDYRWSADPFRMPGSFIYRSFDLDNDGKRESYIFAVLGSEETPGMDIYSAERDWLVQPVGDGHWHFVPDGKPDGVIWVTGGGLLEGVSG